MASFLVTLCGASAAKRSEAVLFMAVRLLLRDLLVASMRLSGCCSVLLFLFLTVFLFSFSLSLSFMSPSVPLSVSQVCSLFLCLLRLFSSFLSLPLFSLSMSLPDFYQYSALRMHVFLYLCPSAFSLAMFQSLADPL